MTKASNFTRHGLGTVAIKDGTLRLSSYELSFSMPCCSPHSWQLSIFQRPDISMTWDRLLLHCCVAPRIREKDIYYISWHVNHYSESVIHRKILHTYYRCKREAMEQNVGQTEDDCQLFRAAGVESSSSLRDLDVNSRYCIIFCDSKWISLFFFPSLYGLYLVLYERIVIILQLRNNQPGLFQFYVVLRNAM